ncbi:uncharacterized protein PV09_00259 [Verruconis gallopava]|uniref:WW domain-containing oxidoreductase n=1 Tax=Verruconis gallopava TaxID=253628 RepID=A0A0D1Y2T9_9PEZI|nr:uncharacterized protein PV09_00259 [Verruconis gallopava]KIW09361.1 hypothetical protein PV09_00259 [Verruconis gallopava]
MSRYAERYASRKGPGDQRPTALEIVQDENLVGKLTGRVALVTGVSSGIGIETMRAFHAAGLTVYGTVRNLAKGQKVVDEILAADPDNKARIELIEIDLESFDSIRAGAAEFLRKENTLNILVNNAGVMACPEGRTKDGWEIQFGTNHLGHFLLFQLLKATLLASATPEFPSRVVSVSSIGHRSNSINFENINLEGEYEPFKAYGQSKTANIWFANEIERRYGAKHLHATSVHPGGILSGLMVHVADTPEIKSLSKDPVALAYFKTPEQGAATSVYAALSEEWKNKGGKYLSDCVEQSPFPSDASHWMSIADGDGYERWAYDPESEKKLWATSLKAVNIEDDQKNNN